MNLKEQGGEYGGGGLSYNLKKKFKNGKNMKVAQTC